MIQVLICFIVCVFLYLIYKRFGITGGFIFISLITFGYLYYDKTLQTMNDKGTLYIVLTVISILLLQFIITSIIYYIFDRVPLLVYLILSTIIEYFMKTLIIFIITSISNLNLKANNSTSFKEQVKYITSTINLNIDLINVGTGSQMISLDYSCNNPSVLYKVVTTSDVEFTCEKSTDLLGEPDYIFYINGINRYRGNNSKIICSKTKCE